jgi:hypothetical protein
VRQPSLSLGRPSGDLSPIGRPENPRPPASGPVRGSSPHPDSEKREEEIDMGEANERHTQVDLVRIRMAGSVHTRIDLSEHGTPHARVNFTFGGTMVHIRHRKVAELARQVWETAGVHGHHLPTQVPQHMLRSTQGTGPVAVIVTLGESIDVSGELVTIQELRRRAIALKVGPLVWLVLDKHAYYTGLEGWKQVESLL